MILESKNLKNSFFVPKTNPQPLGPIPAPQTMTPFDTGLCTLRKQYFSLYPPHLIDLDLDPPLSLARHQPWIVRSLISSFSCGSSHAGMMLASKYPPADDYQRKFWKLLISALEAELRDDQAVAEELVRYSAVDQLEVYTHSPGGNLSRIPSVTDIGTRRPNSRPLQPSHHPINLPNQRVNHPPSTTQKNPDR